MTAAIADLTPRDLTAAERRCVELLAAGRRLPRVRGGWGFAPDRVTLAVASRLTARGIVRRDFTGRNARLVLTYAGKVLAAIVAARAERRAGA